MRETEFKQIARPVPAEADQPPPIPPAAPQAGDCCRGGCDPCVFDLYEDELARYEEALRRWQLEQVVGNGTK